MFQGQTITHSRNFDECTSIKIGISQSQVQSRLSKGVKVDGSKRYTQCTVKLRPNFQRIAQLKCTTNEKRNLSEHGEKNFK